MRKELRQHIAQEFRYAATKMQEVTQPAKKLYYFSVLFSEVQRVLNWEWDRDLVLVFTVTQHTHTQINAAIQTPAAGLLPIDWKTINDKLTQVASDLATYYENKENDDNRKEIYQILGRIAEISYAISGNGSYLYEKGAFKF
jgi:hypothetical protein